jgi:DNA-binding NtrC family response regulator
VGGEEAIRVDVRLVTSTNRDLKQMVETGRFREDLYYRIKVFEIEIPPLRRRREDIPPLVNFFLDRYAPTGLRLTPEALDILIKYPFPGNVRELEHIVQRTATLVRGGIIRPSDLPGEIRHHGTATQGTLAQSLEAVEREMIVSALERTDWVQTKAAELLGISERVLRYKMKKGGVRKGA